MLLNVLIALMNSTYAHVFQVQELHWRRQFLQQVLFLEATPPALIPHWLGAKTTDRPAHHIAGTLHAMTASGGVMDIPTYCARRGAPPLFDPPGSTPIRPTGFHPYTTHGAPHHGARVIVESAQCVRLRPATRRHADGAPSERPGRR